MSDEDRSRMMNSLRATFDKAFSEESEESSGDDEEEQYIVFIQEIFKVRIMIRYQYIYNQVLQIYKQMENIEFPIEPSDIIARLPNCKLMTYAKFAKLNNCSVEDVAALCESSSGCTHYDIANDRYLILWNNDRSDNNVSGRRRWTKAHELGHVVLRHLPLMTEPKIAEEDEDFFWDERPTENLNHISTAAFEQEANVFAATLLCPMPFFEMMEIE